MVQCYKCEVEITIDNEAEEHIILNACGGRLKSKELLCKDCNSKFGETFDSELAKSTNDLANLLLIKRQRGQPQAIKGTLKSTGEDYYLLYGGKPMRTKPIINETVNGKKVELKLILRDEYEARKILEGLKKKKIPNLDIENTLKTATYTRQYFDEPIQFQCNIGGKEVFKSITKSAINYFIYKGGERKYIKHLFPYLDGLIDLDIVWMHFPIEIIYAPMANEVSHVIKLVGNPTERILYAYIELFNTHNFIVKLNDEYDGRSFDETYAFELMEIKELTKNIFINYSREKLLDLFINKNVKPFEEVQRRFIRILSIAMEKQSSNHQEKLVNNAINNSFKKHPQGIPITKEMLDEFIKEASEEFAPYIIHNLKLKKRNKNNP